MKPILRLADMVHMLTRKVTHREERSEEFALICTGGVSHLVFLAAQLERFRLALGGPNVPLVVLASHETGAAHFLFDDRAEITTFDFDRLGEDRTYRANSMSEMFQSYYKGVVNIDYHRHPDLQEALVGATQRPAMAIKPAPLSGMERQLEECASLYQTQFDSGPVGTKIPERWENFGFVLSGEDPDLPAATPYSLSADLLPEAVVFERPTVLLQPFCPDPSRQMPADFYGPLLDALPDDYQVLMLGDSSLLERTPDLKSLLDRDNVSLEETDLARALPMMLGAKLVIAMDGAPMHLAVISGAPTLGLAHDAGNGDLLPYPADRSPALARILIGDEINAETAIASIRELL